MCVLSGTAVFTGGRPVRASAGRGRRCFVTELNLNRERGPRQGIPLTPADPKGIPLAPTDPKGIPLIPTDPSGRAAQRPHRTLTFRTTAYSLLPRPTTPPLRALRNPTTLTGAILRFTAGAARPALRTAQHAPAELSEKAHWLTGSSSGHHTTTIEPKTKGSLEEPNGDRLSVHTWRAPSAAPPCGTHWGLLDSEPPPHPG